METSGNPLTCKECGAEVLEDSQFCHACGKEVTPSDECPSCHAKLVEGAKFCRKCGSALDQQEQLTLTDHLTLTGDTDVQEGPGNKADSDSRAGRDDPVPPVTEDEYRDLIAEESSPRDTTQPDDGRINPTKWIPLLFGVLSAWTSSGFGTRAWLFDQMNRPYYAASGVIRNLELAAVGVAPLNPFEAAWKGLSLGRLDTMADVLMDFGVTDPEMIFAPSMVLTFSITWITWFGIIRLATYVVARNRRHSSTVDGSM